MDLPFITLSSSDSTDANVCKTDVLSTNSDTSGSPASARPDATLIPTAPIHASTRFNYHTKYIAKFAEEMEAVANQDLPSRGPTRYKEVKVLLVRWEEDDLDVEWELQDLSRVLSAYGFHTETWLIPTDSAHLKMMQKASDFIGAFDDENTLFIVYYGGHAYINSARQLTWSCKRNSKYSTLNWSACQSLFEYSKSDTLLLLDCCAAAAAAATPNNSGSSTEIIAACGWEQWAPEPGRHSFTNAVIEVLEEWLEKRPVFSAAQLSREVTEVLKQPRPKRSVESSRTPVYLVATSNPKSPSIEIRRRSRSHGLQNPAASPSQCPTQTSTMDQTPLSLRLPTSTKLNESLIPHLMVVIALVKDQVLDSSAFIHWLKQFPASVQHCLMQGLHLNNPTLTPIPFVAAERDNLSRDLAFKLLEQLKPEEPITSRKRPAEPPPTSARYQDVHVLLLRWEEDPMGVQFDLNDLAKVFEISYGYNTEIWLIPTKESFNALMIKALSMVEDFGKDGNLLIVYYSGHGLMNESRQPVWSCTADPSYASMPWYAVQALFGKAKSDILLLLDCCAATIGAFPASQSHRVVEIIAACAFGTWAPIPGPRSFRRTVIDVLEDWAIRPRFSTCMLYREALNRLWQDIPERKGAGKAIERRPTPIHIVMKYPESKSVELCPRRGAKRVNRT